jgi:HlyD family secretion protein
MPSKPEKRRTIPLILWASGLVALILVVVAVHYLTRERVDVRIAKVSYQDLIKTSSTNGNVEPIDDFQPHAEVAGVVEEVYVNVGDKVKPGQLLLKMDDADAKARLASAQSNVEAAQLALSDITHGGTQDERNTYASNLSSARFQRQQDATSLAALQQLQQKGAASAAEIAAAQQRIEADDNNIHSIEQHSTQRYGDADRAGAEARLRDAQAALAAAQSSYASVNIQSRIAGTVYAIPVTQYDYVAAGTDLIYVADLNRLQVLAYFDEPEVGNLANGQPVRIVWDAKPNKAWHGEVSVAPSSIVNYQSTRNVGECIITVDDAHGDLQPNADVTIYVTTAVHKHVLSIPREALHTNGDMDNYVYRVIDNKLVRTSVQVTGGIVNNISAEITGGLAEGDVVATSPTTPRDLTNGLEVIPVE